MSCKDDQELSQRPVAKLEGVVFDARILGTPKNRLLLREAWVPPTVLGGLGERVLAAGDGLLVKGDAEGPSTQLGFPSKKTASLPSSSVVRRRFRGRKVVELLAEAEVEESFIALEAKSGLSTSLT